MTHPPMHIDELVEHWTILDDERDLATFTARGVELWGEGTTTSDSQFLVVASQRRTSGMAVPSLSASMSAARPAMETWASACDQAS